MSDWKYGDVISHRSAHGHGRYMFLVRTEPVRMATSGRPEFWGFTGIGLPPACLEIDEDACPYSHNGIGHKAHLGGHPDVAWGDHAWELLDE